MAGGTPRCRHQGLQIQELASQVGDGRPIAVIPNALPTGGDDVEVATLLDTSAVNHLHDDPDMDTLLPAIRTFDALWVSALNVAEVCRTRDPDRRRSILDLLKSMTGSTRPLEVPTILLRRAIDAYSKRADHFSYSIAETDSVWAVIHDPDLLDEKNRAILDDQLRAMESDFITMHREARPHFQALFECGVSRPLRAAVLLRAYAGNQSFLHSVVNPIYHKAVGRDLPETEVLPLLRTVPELSAFLVSWGHSIYRRAVAREGYGKANAGNLDLWFATYLPRVGRFVTGDVEQYRALRLVARFMSTSCTVLTYEGFRKRLLTLLGA